MGTFFLSVILFVKFDLLKCSKKIKGACFTTGILHPKHILLVIFPERKSIDIHIENSGHVESPGFPNSPYPSNAYLQWKFRADPQHRIQLDFDDLILEDDCQRDFIKIYDSLVPIEKRAMTEWDKLSLEFKVSVISEKTRLNRLIFLFCVLIAVHF